MKIAILTQYYPPEHGAPQNRLHDLAKRWKEAGNEVIILTAMPNYPQGAIFSRYKHKIFFKEEIDGVQVVRSWIFASPKKSTVVQLTVYFSFVFSSFLAGMLFLRKKDVLICESPPLFLGITAFLLSKFKKASLIMNISDLWPESAVQLGIISDGIILKILEWFESFLYKHSLLVTCQTEGIEQGVKKSCPEASTFLFPNGVDLALFPVKEFNSELAQSFGIKQGDFIVGYGGNHGRSQALRQVIDAATVIQNRKEYGDIKFVLFGDGPEKQELIEYAKLKNLKNLFFFPSQKREKMSEIQGLWSIGLVPLKDIKLFEGARPSKMFELMAGEIPFIFCGRGEGAEIARKSGCAMIVPPENPEKLAGMIIHLKNLPSSQLKRMGKKGREFVSKYFNREVLAEELLEYVIDKMGCES